MSIKPTPTVTPWGFASPKRPPTKPPHPALPVGDTFSHPAKQERLQSVRSMRCGLCHIRILHGCGNRSVNRPRKLKTVYVSFRPRVLGEKFIKCLQSSCVAYNVPPIVLPHPRSGQLSKKLTYPQSKPTHEPPRRQRRGERMPPCAVERSTIFRPRNR